MGFLSSMIFEKRATAGEVVSMRNPPEWLASMIGGQMTNAGTRVSEETALGVAAVYACIRLIAWTTASLPLVVYEDLNPGKRRAKEKNIYSLLHDSPNPEQTSFEWRSLTSVHQNLWGAGISEIEFDAKGFPIALWPLPPWKVTPKRTINRNLVYEVSVDGITRTLWPNQVVVFPSLQTTADDWKSPIRVHRETVGYAMALREFGSKTFGAGTNPARLNLSAAHRWRVGAAVALALVAVPLAGWGRPCAPRRSDGARSIAKSSRCPLPPGPST